MLLWLIFIVLFTWIHSKVKVMFPVVLEAIFQSLKLILRTIKPIKAKYFKHLPLPTSILQAFTLANLYSSSAFFSCKIIKVLSNLPMELFSDSPMLIGVLLPYISISFKNHSVIMPYLSTSCCFCVALCACVKTSKPTICFLRESAWFCFISSFSDQKIFPSLGELFIQTLTIECPTVVIFDWSDSPAQTSLFASGRQELFIDWVNK